MVLSIDASGDGISLQKAIGKDGEIEIIEQEEKDNIERKRVDSPSKVSRPKVKRSIY